MSPAPLAVMPLRPENEGLLRESIMRLVGGASIEASVKNLAEVDTYPAFLPPADETDPAQVGEMKRKRRRGDGQLLADRARAHALGPGLHQQAKDRKTGFLSQCGETFGGGF